MSQSQNTDTTATTSSSGETEQSGDNTDDLNNYDSGDGTSADSAVEINRENSVEMAVSLTEFKNKLSRRNVTWHRLRPKKIRWNEKQKQLKSCAKKKNSGMISFLRSVKRSQRLLHSRRPGRCAINSRN